MKKIILLPLMSLLLLNGCNSSSQGSDDYKLDLKIATPAGSPATAFYKHLGESDYLEVNGDATNVLAYFTSTDSTQRKDVIVAPTNAGIASINAGADFKIAATVTFGNFFLLSTGKDTNETLDKGDKVIAFQQNGVAGKLFNFVYGDRELDVTYLKDAAAVKNKVLSEDVDAGYVLLAQPVVNAVLSQKKEQGYKIFANVQNDYQTKTGGKQITQASIFVRNDVNNEKAKTLLINIKKDVEDLINTPSNLVKYTANIEDEVFSAKLTGTKTLITNLLSNNNQLGLGFKYAKDNKTAIDSFIANFGMRETSEEIYFDINK